ncbi:MAG: electron transport complex subunit RsxC [Bacillota bacterium]
MSLLTFKQGIHPDYRKELTNNEPLKEAVRPKEVVIPLQQHIGAPLNAIVEKGDHVDMGQKIGDTDSFVAAPVHASVSGTVKDITEVQTASGTKTLSVIIEADEEDQLAENLDKHENYENLSPDEIRNIVREAGIAGMGGAMFPTHVKLSVPDDKEVDYFVLNGAECEPYLTVDHRMMIERPNSVLNGMKIMMKAVDVKKGFIGIEENKPDAIEAMKKVVDDEEYIEVKVFETKYPQGGEKMMIKAALDREVPAGGLPLDVGVVVNNVTTAVAVSDAVKKGLPLINRSVTVTGSGIENPQNFICRIGTRIEDLIEQAGGFKDEVGKIVVGGPMTGSAQHSLKTPIVKGSSGILVLPPEEVNHFDPKPCIRCARCVDVCPMSLVPVKLSNFAEHSMYERMEDFNIENCIKCGSCSYICPSNRPLLQNIEIGQAELAAEKRKEE